jgi:hypothetical protein
VANFATPHHTSLLTVEFIKSATDIARENNLKVSDHTVAEVRREMEAGAQIAQLAQIVGNDGKVYQKRSRQPAKPSPAPEPPEPHDCPTLRRARRLAARLGRRCSALG